MGYRFKMLEGLDDIPLLTAAECGRVAGMDRKVFSQRAKRLGLGQQRSLTESGEGRMYYSVDDVLTVTQLGEASRDLIRSRYYNEDRKGLIREHNTKEVVYDISGLLEENKTNNRLESDDLTKLRNSIGDTAYKTTLRKNGLLTREEIVRLFDEHQEYLDKLIAQEILPIYKDGKDFLFYFEDFTRAVVEFLDTIENIPTPISIGENQILKDINKLSMFLYNKEYRNDVLKEAKTLYNTSDSLFTIKDGMIKRNK